MYGNDNKNESKKVQLCEYECWAQRKAYFHANDVIVSSCFPIMHTTERSHRYRHLHHIHLRGTVAVRGRTTRHQRERERESGTTITKKSFWYVYFKLLWMFYQNDADVNDDVMEMEK